MSDQRPSSWFLYYKFFWVNCHFILSNEENETVSLAHFVKYYIVVFFFFYKCYLKYHLRHSINSEIALITTIPYFTRLYNTSIIQMPIESNKSTSAGLSIERFRLNSFLASMSKVTPEFIKFPGIRGPRRSVQEHNEQRQVTSLLDTWSHDLAKWVAQRRRRRLCSVKHAQV